MITRVSVDASFSRPYRMSGIGAAIEFKTARIFGGVREHRGTFGVAVSTASSGEGEIRAIGYGLSFLKEKIGKFDVDGIYSDSQFAVRVCNGEQDDFDSRLEPLVNATRARMRRLGVRAIYVPREQNKQADEAARNALANALRAH